MQTFKKLAVALRRMNGKVNRLCHTGVVEMFVETLLTARTSPAAVGGAQGLGMKSPLITGVISL